MYYVVIVGGDVGLLMYCVFEYFGVVDEIVDMLIGEGNFVVKWRCVEYLDLVIFDQLDIVVFFVLVEQCLVVI